MEFDKIMAQPAARKSDHQAEVDRDSLAPVIEEELDEMDALIKSTTEHPTSSEKVTEDVEIEHAEQAHERGQVDDEDYDAFFRSRHRLAKSRIAQLVQISRTSSI